MRCARHALPGLDWSKVEEAHDRRDFQLPVGGEFLDFGVTEADIANVDTRFEFKEEGDPGVVNTDAVNDDPLGDLVIIDAPYQREVAASANQES